MLIIFQGLLPSSRLLTTGIGTSVDELRNPEKDRDLGRATPTLGKKFSLLITFRGVDGTESLCPSLFPPFAGVDILAWSFSKDGRGPALGKTAAPAVAERCGGRGAGLPVLPTANCLGAGSFDGAKGSRDQTIPTGPTDADNSRTVRPKIVVGRIDPPGPPRAAAAIRMVDSKEVFAGGAET